MGLRDWINDNSSIATIGAAALLVVSLGWLTVPTGSRAVAPGNAYYYDTETGGGVRGVGAEGAADPEPGRQ